MITTLNISLRHYAIIFIIAISSYYFRQFTR